MVGKFSVALLAVVLVSQVVLAEDKPVPPKGPPPRFITVGGVDSAKGQVIFDVQILVEIPGLETKPNYVHPAEGFKVPLKIAKWSGIDGKEIGTEAAVKRLKPGVMVLLSADGAAVDGAYLRMFKEDTLVLVVPVDELPVPFIPHRSSVIPIRKVGER